MQTTITAAACAAALFLSSEHSQRMIAVVLITLAVVLAYVAINECSERRRGSAACSLIMCLIASYYAGVIGGAW